MYTLVEWLLQIFLCSCGLVNIKFNRPLVYRLDWLCNYCIALDRWISHMILFWNFVAARLCIQRKNRERERETVGRRLVGGLMND